MNIIYNIPLKLSSNSIYAGVHWTKRNKHKQLYRAVPFVASPVVEYPVVCHYHFELLGRSLDVSNCSYMVKLIEDCLVHKGILKDDTQKYVNKIITTASKGDDVCKIVIDKV
jgi:hypothetical protein